MHGRTCLADFLLLVPPQVATHRTHSKPPCASQTATASINNTVHVQQCTCTPQLTCQLSTCVHMMRASPSTQHVTGYGHLHGLYACVCVCMCVPPTPTYTPKWVRLASTHNNLKGRTWALCHRSVHVTLRGTPASAAMLCQQLPTVVVCKQLGTEECGLHLHSKGRMVACLLPATVLSKVPL